MSLSKTKMLPSVQPTTVRLKMDTQVMAESWHFRIPLFLKPATGSIIVQVLSAEQTMTRVRIRMFEAN